MPSPSALDAHARAASVPLRLPALYRRALAALEDGRVVGIFPEGPFSVRGQLEAGRDGMAMLALRSAVPVVPTAIHGTYQDLVGRRFYVPRRHPLRVRFGAPRAFASVAGGGEAIRPFNGPNGDGRRGARAVVTDRIMTDLALLLR